jgi:hypothetical protein
VRIAVHVVGSGECDPEHGAIDSHKHMAYGAALERALGHEEARLHEQDRPREREWTQRHRELFEEVGTRLNR